MKKALSFSRKIILCLPRNIRIEEIVGLLVDSFENSQIISDRACLEVEKIYVNNKYKMNLIYFGNTTKVMQFEGSIYIYFYQIAKSIEYSHIYGKILKKGPNGFDLKEKESIKKLIEDYGMIKVLNAVDRIARSNSYENNKIEALVNLLEF